MNQEIHFKGLSLTPDDHLTAPGELSVCANVELHNGALRPSVINGTEVTNPLKYEDVYKTGIIPDSDPVRYTWQYVEHVYKLQYVHKISDGSTHFIASYKDSATEGDYDQEKGIYTYVRFFNADGSYNSGIKAFDKETVYSITSVGNTLVILTSSGVHYAKWDDSRYVYIGSHYPECKLSFGLQGRYGVSPDTFTFSIPNWSTYGWDSNGIGYSIKNPTSSQSNQSEEQNLDNATSVTEQVLSHVNKFINDYHDKGEFIFPFLVRYAYRLYDGSLIMHSAPVMMLTNSGTTPFVFARYYNTGDEVSFSDCAVGAGLFKLDYQLLNGSLIDELKKWSDIIKSVDIFVSRPLCRYDASGLVERINKFRREYDNFNDYCVAKATGELNGVQADIGHLGDRYQRHDMRSFLFYGRTYIPGYRVDLPVKKDSKFNREIKECAEFFLLASIKPDSLSTERIIIDLKEGFYGSIKEEEVNIGTIYSRELMSDDYDSHDTVIAKKAYVYNSRLNLADIEKRLFDGYDPGAQFEYTDGLITPVPTDLNNDGIVNDSNDNLDIANDCSDKVQITYVINENGKEIVVAGPEFEFGYDMPLPYIYYPNPNCIKAIIRRRTILSELVPLYYGTRYFVVNMEPHPSLNGALFFNGFENENSGEGSSVRPSYTVSTNPTTLLPNKIYTSEINNPFYFPVESILTVGFGSILGLASSTRALSQGQFGQYPMMAFCTDGVWALDVSATGSFSAVHLISNEACINPDSICQLNQTVLFASRRGISQVVGEDVASVSNILDGPVFNAMTKLPSIVLNLVQQIQTVEDGYPLYTYLVGSIRHYAYNDGTNWIDKSSGDPIQNSESITFEPVMEPDPRIIALLQNSIQPFDFFTDAKLFYDFAFARVIALKNVGGKGFAYVFSLTDNSWSTMLMDEMPLAIVNAYPYTYLQNQDGSLLYLNKSYDYQNTEVTPAIIITRSLSFSNTMQVIQAFQQINDCNSVPLLGIYASNDNINWAYVGKAQRNHYPYLPGHPFRFFRIVIQMNMKQCEQYSTLILDIIEKYQKL